MGRGSASRPISFPRYAEVVTADVAHAIDELYGVSPKEFSSARNARAAALKAAGREADAQTIRRLAKPSPFLWATNQLARQDPQRVAHFVRAVRGGLLQHLF